MPDVAINRRQILLSAVESSYGVDRAPQEANSYQAIRLIEPFTVDLGQEVIEQNGGLSTLGFSRPYATVRPVGVTFRTFVVGHDAGSYTANNKPPLGDLLRGCGMIETFVSSNEFGRPAYTYAPAGRVQSQASHTLVAHVDGYEHRILGAMGNVNFIMVGASPIIAEFNFRGLLSTEANTLRSTPVGLPSGTPPRWVGSGSIIVASLAAVVENMNFNTNNKIFEQRASLALSGSGIIKVVITERSPGGSFDPEATNASSYDWINAWRSTSGAYVNVAAGTVQGNRFTLTSSQIISKTLRWQDKEGLAVFGIDYQAYERNGNDEYRIMFD
jgi:hypothetical protein